MFGEEDTRRACKLYQDGFTMREAGEMMGISTNAVRDRLIKAGVEIRTRGNKDGDNPSQLPSQVIDQTAFMYQELKLSMIQIAEIQGVFRTTVKYRLRKAGVPIRSRHESQVLAFQQRRQHGCKDQWPFETKPRD